MRTSEPDVRSTPIMGERVAETAAALLERMTGDRCTIMQAGWNGRFILQRQSPEGKIGRG